MTVNADSIPADTLAMYLDRKIQLLQCGTFDEARMFLRFGRDAVAQALPLLDAGATEKLMTTGLVSHFEWVSGWIANPVRERDPGDVLEACVEASAQHF